MNAFEIKLWLDNSIVTRTELKGSTTLYELASGDCLVVDNHTGSGWQFI